MSVDTTNAVPVVNPARTGALRATARTDAAPIAVAPHYHSRTALRVNYLYIFLYALSIIASIFYFVVRVVYIATGRASVKIPQNATFETTIDGRRTNATLAEILPTLSIGDELTDEILARPELSEVKSFIDEDTYSYWWSCCVLAAEIGGFLLVHISQQMFIRQDTKFYPMPPETVNRLREARGRRRRTAAAAVRQSAAAVRPRRPPGSGPDATRPSARRSRTRRASCRRST